MQAVKQQAAAQSPCGAGFSGARRSWILLHQRRRDSTAANHALISGHAIGGNPFEGGVSQSVNAIKAKAGVKITPFVVVSNLPVVVANDISAIAHGPLHLVDVLNNVITAFPAIGPGGVFKCAHAVFGDHNRFAETTLIID